MSRELRCKFAGCGARKQRVLTHDAYPEWAHVGGYDFCPQHAAWAERDVKLVLPTESGKPGERIALIRIGYGNCDLREEVVFPEQVGNAEANNVLETFGDLTLTPDQQLWLYQALGFLLGKNEAP